MKALLVVAHGSRRETSNDEVRGLCRRMEASGLTPFGRVSAAFLELAEPSIAEGIEECVAAGATEVVVVPYFLSAGRHVSEDIPAEVARAARRHPQVSVRLTPHLGAAAGIAPLVKELGETAAGDPSRLV